MRLGIVKKIVKRFDEEIVFFKSVVASPGTVGSVIPTSHVTAFSMAQQIDLSSNLPVLELGPGTGVITKAILNHGVSPGNLYCVEYSKEFTQRLRLILPEVNIINGDAFALDDVLGTLCNTRFDTIITSIPLLNFPMSTRKKLINDLLERIPHGRPIILFSYGVNAPVPSDGQRFEVTSVKWVLRNVPPARIWAYRRKNKSS